MNISSRPRGMGLLDLMLALAVSALILILGVNYYQSVVREQKINRTIGQLRGISGAVSKLVAEGTTTQSISSGTGDLSKAVQTMLPPSTFKSPWDRSSITLDSGLHNISVTNSQTNQKSECLATEITVGGIPKQAQTALLNRFAVSFPSSQVPPAKSKITFQICIE